MWKSEESWKSEKRNRKIVMNEKFVKNIAMNEKFLKEKVMNAKIDPKFVRWIYPCSKLVDGTNLQPSKTHIYWKNLLMRTNCGC